MEQQIQGDARVPSTSIAAYLEETRAELKRTIRLHEVGTGATLAIMWCLCIILTFGVAFALIQITGPWASASNFSLASFTSVSICMMAWAACCNYLWKCYQTGLQDVRDLYSQLQAAECSTETSPQSPADNDAEAANECPIVPLPKQRATDPIAEDVAPSVVQLDRYRR